MRRLNPVDTKRVDVERVTKYFTDLAELVTTGRDKIVVSRNKNTGEVSFHIGHSRLRIMPPTLVEEGVAL